MEGTHSHTNVTLVWELVPSRSLAPGKNCHLLPPYLTGAALYLQIK